MGIAQAYSYNKSQQDALSQIYLVKYSTCFGQVHRPSSPIACIQCQDTPDDEEWTCPKHVEYFIK